MCQQATQKVDSTDQPSSVGRAQHQEDGVAEQTQPDLGQTEAPAAADGQHSELEGVNAARKESAVQEASLAPDVGKPDQAKGSTTENMPFATTEAELSGNAQPQMVTANDMQAQTTGNYQGWSSSETAAAISAAPEEPQSVAGLGDLTQALQDSHIDPEEDLFLDAAPAKVSSSEQHAVSAEEKDSDSATMHEAAERLPQDAADGVGVDSGKAETLGTATDESYAASADAASGPTGERREDLRP